MKSMLPTAFSSNTTRLLIVSLELLKTDNCSWHQTVFELCLPEKENKRWQKEKEKNQYVLTIKQSGAEFDNTFSHFRHIMCVTGQLQLQKKIMPKYNAPSKTANKF